MGLVLGEVYQNVELYMKGKSEDELGRDSFRACEIPKR
ncbi:unnamed protein product [Arabidopsis lyrata]|nr:unnamed protein product [Arabidopsis lyrata]